MTGKKKKEKWKKKKMKKMYKSNDIKCHIMMNDAYDNMVNLGV